MTPKNIVCLTCDNYLISRKCLAFEKIPSKIWLENGKHKKPLQGQGNNITFEPLENAKR